ncbi:MAG: S-layer homology domain-containing protein [Clostridiaceae bacterium]|nr:S-layer homology domain-containing protein [Clostridiaceae bacterium]
MKKRLLSMVLAVYLVLSLLPNVAHAAYYSPVLMVTLDGDAASPQDLTSNPYIDRFALRFALTESPKGTYKYTGADPIYGDNILCFANQPQYGPLGIWPFYNGAFSVSEDNPFLSVSCYTITYKPGAYGAGTEYKEIAAYNADYKFSGASFTRASYVQTGWTYTDGGNKTVELGQVKNDIAMPTTLYPVWTLASYPVTINVKKDGSAFGAGAPTVTFGTTAGSAVANGTSVGDGTYNIYADGIDTGVVVTVNGSAASVDLNYYTVTFQNDDNTSTLDTQTVLSGQTAAYGGAPLAKASTAQYSYAFSKWVTTQGGAAEATLSNITAVKTVYSSFTPTLQSYTITWKKDVSHIIGTTTVAYGATPAYPDPNNTGYIFSGWAPAIASVTGAATYTATWTLDTYPISYMLNGGTATNPTSYQYTTDVFTLSNPTRAGYSFLGWTGSNGSTAQPSVSIPTGSTGNKTYTANWKADKPASAPDVSIVTARTDKSLTITTETDYEYSVDNGAHWYSSGSGSYTFTELTPDKAYNLVWRIPAVTAGDTSAASDASSPLPVTTKTASASIPTPTPPTIGTGTDKPASGSISISAVEGNEYYISTSATADWSGTPNGYFKAASDGAHKFDHLSPATQYYIHVRVAETDDAMPSASAYAAQYTLPATPLASVVTVDYAEETISFAATYEISTNETFSPPIDSGSTMQADMTYYVRLKAIVGGAPASEAVSFTIPARPAAPSVITADKTKNSITITPVAGLEYKVGSSEWQGSGSFTGLSPNTDYTVYARVKAVSSGSVSFASELYSTTIKTKADGSAGFSLPTISVAPTYDPAQTLADISLQTGWTWSSPTTVPTVINTGYGAVYTPTDTDTVDYSDVIGYAVDGGGKVTITRVVPITVNLAAPTAADFTFSAPASLDFSGTAKPATVMAKGGISGMGAFTARYYLDGVETVPTNAGTYTVKIDIEQGYNYAAASDITDSSWAFTIAKVSQAPLSVTNKPSGVIYGDNFTLATTGGNGAGAVTWAVTSGSSATVDEDTGAVTITGVDETTITATKAADGNYTDAVTDTYTFTPAKRLITVEAPSATGGWTKAYDGKTDFNQSIITVGSITNKVGSDAVNVYVQSAAYDTADIGSGDKTLTITYATDGTDSKYYLLPIDTVISTASITGASPTITLKNKTAVYTNKIIEIDTANIIGVTDGTTPDGPITYTYYTKDSCIDTDKTSIDKSGALAPGGAPKAAGTYYVKATIATSGNYAEATSDAVKLTIYYPSSGEDKAMAPVIVDGKTVNMGTSEVKDDTTTVKVDQNKMTEQLKSAGDSVVIPITSKTDTASAQLVVQNIENMAQRSMTLTVKANNVSYEIPSESVDTAAILKSLGASDSSKVPLNVTISKLSNKAVTIKDGTLMAPPIAFTITATYNGKNVEVDRFESYVERIIEIPSGIDPTTITTAVVVEANGAERHVPTLVYSEGGKWFAKINSMTNSTYALIQNNVSFTDTAGKWYVAVVTEMASRKVIGGIGENIFAGDRSITRAEFAAILIRALGLPADGTSGFSDVPTGAWYSGSVATAAQYGLVTGKGDNRFDPDDYITRQEAMTMLQRAARLTDYSGTSGSLEGFTDAGSVGVWAQSAAKWNVGSGLIVGSDGQLRPNDNISRAESATIILRLLQKAGLIDVRS